MQSFLHSPTVTADSYCSDDSGNDPFCLFYTLSELSDRKPGYAVEIGSIYVYRDGNVSVLKEM